MGAGASVGGRRPEHDGALRRHVFGYSPEPDHRAHRHDDRRRGATSGDAWRRPRRAGLARQVDLFGDAEDEGKQNVLLRMRPQGVVSGRPGLVFDSHEADLAVALVLERRRLNLVGLHCDVGSADDDFVSYPAGVGDMIAQMEHIRRQRGLLLTCLGIGGGKFFATDDEHPLCELIARVDESVDDACATLRFPRPVVVIAAGTEVIGRSAA